MTLTAQCSRCLKRLTLVHKLKTRPEGQLRRHKDDSGRSCFGTVLRDTIKERKPR